MEKFLVTPHRHTNNSKGYSPGKTYTMKGGVYKSSGSGNLQIISDSMEVIHGSPCQQEYTVDELAAFERESVNGSALYGGPLLGHYGHFLIQTLARLSSYDPQKHDVIVFTYIADRCQSGLLDSTIMPPFVKELFELLGIPLGIIYVASSTALVFDKLEINPAEWQIPHPPTTKHLRWISERTSANIDSKATNSGIVSKRCVYVSRTAHYKGLTAGEPQIEFLLRANGYEIVHGETLSMKDKIVKLSGVETLIGLSGSALLVTCTLPKQPKSIIQIARNKMASSMALQRKLNAQANSANHEIFAILDETFSTNEAMTLLDLGAVVEGLEKALGQKLLLASMLDQNRANDEYRDLIAYYTLSKNLGSSLMSPTRDQIYACARLAEYRRSPKFFIVAIRSAMLINDPLLAFELSCKAHKNYPLNPELDNLYKRLEALR